MFRRLLILLLIYAPIGLLLAYFISETENEKLWSLALIVYLVIAAVLGNIYVLFGGRWWRKK